MCLDRKYNTSLVLCANRLKGSSNIWNGWSDLFEQFFLYMHNYKINGQDTSSNTWNSGGLYLYLNKVYIFNPESP